MARMISADSPSEIRKYDIALLKLLAQGVPQDEISRQFASKGMIPAGMSSIEKRISSLKDYFEAKNNLHLIAITKDLGLI
jgi:two-component system capsular synthesis response regulator RcsB